MTQQIKHYNYSEKQITALCADDSGDDFIWIAFAKDSDNNCVLFKNGAHNPYQKYYELDQDVEEIISMKIGGDYLYVALNDETNIGYMYHKSTPLTTSQALPIPSGITEAPVDVLVTATDLWFLTPGTTSGTTAKLIKMSLAGTYDSTIELNEIGKTVTDAVSLTEDSVSGDLYIGTNTAPAELVRIYEITGGAYDYDVTLLS